jgi:peptidyl-prolyl cis-trans isomerase B (cyclophilin B)
MGVRMKKRSAIIVIALILTTLFSSTANASQRKTTPSVKNKLQKTLCTPTVATAHFPKQVGSPPKPRRVVHNRVLTFKTNCGDITVVTDGLRAPFAVTAVTYLALAGFYDNSLCHRLTTSGIFILQCGDPTSSGNGGPAFIYNDENLPTAIDNNYPVGTVAMANSGPNTNGSQFFFVYSDSTLSPKYTILGVVTKGLDIVKAIAALGVADGSGDGMPKQAIAIQSVSVK